MDIDVGWEGEMITALEDLKKSRKYNKMIKEQLKKIEKIGVID